MTDMSDDDIGVDNDDFLILHVAPRNAADEPADLDDMTALEAQIVEAEDRLNDQALRDLILTDCYDFLWEEDSAVFTGKAEDFIGPEPGPTISVTDSTTPIDVFRQMVDNDFVDKVCTETNRHARQRIETLTRQGKMGSYSRLHRWIDVTREEMFGFMATLILVGLYPLSSEDTYFCFNGFGTLRYFSRIMSYNRYTLLKTNLNFVDNDTVIPTDRLAQIQLISDYFNEKFTSLYNLSKDIVIDESMLKKHGRLNYTEKVSSKTAQVGVKTYELSESSTGYLWKFFVDVGKQKTDKPKRPNYYIVYSEDETVDMGEESTTDTNADGRKTKRVTKYFNVEMEHETVDMTEEFTTVEGLDDALRPDNVTAKIVFDLTKPLLNRGHTLIMDSFYNSPLLARYFKQQKTDCYGTLRLNREFVPTSLKTLMKTDLSRDEVVAAYSTDLTVMLWRDVNLVSMISTYHDLDISAVQKNHKLTYKPTIVLDYNKTMEGVDRKDRYLSEQPLERVKSCVWYRKFFRKMFNVAVFNCFVIFTSNGHKLSYRKFRQLLAEDILRQYRNLDLTYEPRIANRVSKTVARQSPVTTSSRRPFVGHDHFPVRTGTKKTRCWLCARRRRDSRTVWKCMECNVNLCINNCFRDFHKPKPNSEAGNIELGSCVGQN